MSMMRNGQYYCFNPKCLLPSSRVFTQCHPHYYIDQCEKWRTSKKELLSYCQYKLPFRVDQPLLFTQNPIKMIAYVYFNRDQICRYLRNFCRNIVDEIMKGIVQFQARFEKIISNFQSMDQFQEIRMITSGNISSKEKIQAINAFSESYLLKQNVFLPPKQSIETFVHSTNSSLQRMSSLQKYQFPSLINIQSLDLIKHQPINNQQTLLRSDMKNYIRLNSNLGTISFLFREDPQKFINFDEKSNLVSMKCIFCDHFLKIASSKKKIAYKLASYSFLEHIYNAHYNLLKSSYLHRVTGFAVKQLKIPEIQLLAEDAKVRKVFIIDRSLPQYFEHKINPNQFSIAIEVLYSQDKPHSQCAYYRGYNPKSFILLIGQIIQIISIKLRKKLVIYTSQPKRQLINEYCFYEKIQNVQTIIGGGKKEVVAQIQAKRQMESKHSNCTLEITQFDKKIERTLIKEYQLSNLSAQQKIQQSL